MTGQLMNLQIHRKILHQLPEDIIGLITEFNPYIKTITPYEEFLFDMKIQLCKEIKEKIIDGDGEFDDYFIDDFVYSFEFKHKDAEKIFDKDINVLFAMNKFIEEIDEESLFDIYFHYNELDTLNHFIFCYATSVKPHYTTIDLNFTKPKNIRVKSKGIKAFRNPSFDEFKQYEKERAVGMYHETPIRQGQSVGNYVVEITKVSYDECMDINLVKYDGVIHLQILYYMLDVIYDQDGERYELFTNESQLIDICNKFKLAYNKRHILQLIEDERFQDESEDGSDDGSEDGSDDE